MINKLISKIKEYDSIIILRHKRPDLDALGSQRGLALSIKETYPNKSVYITGDMSDNYKFLGEMDRIDNSVFINSLVIICDVAVSNMISDDRYKIAKEVFIIDHHTNTSDVSLNTIIDSSKSSCCEYLVEILDNNNFKIPPYAATSLYGGMVTDSGRFQYSSTTSGTFKIAARLLELGADMNFIYNNIYVESLASKKMKTYFSNKFDVTDMGVAYMFNDKEVFDLFNVEFFAISRGMVNVMAGIEEVKIWANFTYDKDSQKVIGEFRSRGIKIVDIAKKYGGGGHDEACGATLDDFDVAKEVVNDFELLLKELANGKNIK